MSIQPSGRQQALHRVILIDNRKTACMGVLLMEFQLLLTYAPLMQAVRQTTALDAPPWLVILCLGNLQVFGG